MHKLSGGSAGLSLYDLLGEPAPASLHRGETNYTAAKETIDNDREGAEPLIFPDDR